MECYVYMLCDGDVPFYVGKGTHNTNYTNKYRRPHEHLVEAAGDSKHQRNRLKCGIINRIISHGRQVIVKMVADNISNDDATKLESELIQQYKRISDGGVLANIVLDSKSTAVDTRKRQVFCFSITGELIKEFDSIKDAARWCNGYSGSIVSCCTGGCKTTRGYVWSYTPTFPGYVAPNRHTRRVECLSMDGDVLCVYDSVLEASTQLGIVTSSINACIQRKASSAGGFGWRVVGDDTPVRSRMLSGRKPRAVTQYSPSGEVVRTYASLSEASEATGVNLNGIHRCCTQRARVAGGFFWAYSEKQPVIREPIKRSGFFGK